jgi:hypothetical protein
MLYTTLWLRKGTNQSTVIQLIKAFDAQGPGVPIY